VGFQSGNRNTTGSNSVFVGFQSGYDNLTGSNNTALGHEAGPTVDGLTNATAIGYQAKVSVSNALVLGGTGANAVSVGIGTATPTSPLTLAGTLAVPYLEASTNLTLSGQHQTVRRTGACSAITLPSPTGCRGRLYTLINSAQGGNVTLALGVTGNYPIQDDALNSAITSLASRQRLTVQSDGTQWIVISRD
jgi:hypothetical protein